MKKKIKIKERKSKWWKIFFKFFPDADSKQIWITFNKTIWTPGGITFDLFQHEMIHMGQQKNFFKAIWWWVKYIKNPKFRYSQELPAYKKQYEVLVKDIHDRNDRIRLLEKVASVMAGKSYKHMVDYQTVVRDLEYGPDKR
jgi:hypothetical protein